MSARGTARYEQIGWGIGIYVAETDEQARREYEPHFWYYARNLLKTPAPLSIPRATRRSRRCSPWQSAAYARGQGI